MINRKKYFELLNGTAKDVNGNNSIIDLLNYVQENKPKSLFHYRKCTEYTIDAFRDNKIYFNTANNFNDPYDCLVYCDTKKINNQIENMTNIANIKQLQKNINTARFIETRPAQLPKEKATHILETLKGQDLQKIVSNIPNESWETLRNTLKETTKEILYSYVNYYQTEMPLVCFSEKYNNLLIKEMILCLILIH